MDKTQKIHITDIKGIQVGQAQDEQAGTGCSVLLCKHGAVAGVDVRGGAPATRETDLLHPLNMVQKIHGVMLSGGSAFGLDAASGAMQYLEECGCGIDMSYARIPIVCGASLFDLSVGNPNVRPNKEMGYAACLDSEHPSLKEGNFGAGTGASVGKIMGFSHTMKGGIGTYGIQIGDVQVAAIVAVNACGNVVDHETNEPLAGIYDDDTNTIINANDILYAQLKKTASLPLGNTTIGCIVTNATLTKAQCTKIAGIAHNGYAKVIQPAHTMHDGDTIFVMSTQEVSAMPDVVGVLAIEVVVHAIKRAILHATSAYGLKAHCDCTC